MPKFRVVFDTNIFLSAILYGGIPLKLLNLWRKERAFELIISPEILAELIAKLRTKFALPSHLVQEWQELLSQNIIHVLPEYLTHICRDAEDDKIIDTAISGNANYIITGDEDLLILKSYQRIKIIKATKFLDILLTAESSS